MGNEVSEQQIFQRSRYLLAEKMGKVLFAHFDLHVIEVSCAILPSMKKVKRIVLIDVEWETKAGRYGYLIAGMVVTLKKAFFLS